MTADLKRLALVAQNTSNAVVITDTARHITWVNPAFERISGYSLAEVIGRSPALLQTDQTDQNTIRQIRHALDHQQAFTCKILNRSKLGHDYWLAIEIQPMRDDGGELSGFMAIQSDITESLRRSHCWKQPSATTMRCSARWTCWASCRPPTAAEAFWT